MMILIFTKSLLTFYALLCRRNIGFSFHDGFFSGHDGHESNHDHVICLSLMGDFGCREKRCVELGCVCVW